MKEKFVNGYYIKREAYYYVPNLVMNDEPEIMIGIYNVDGGCRFEFKIVETNIGLRLKMYDESWVAFLEFPYLFKALGCLINKENTKVKYTLQDVVRILNENDFVDLTEREKPIEE